MGKSFGVAVAIYMLTLSLKDGSPAQDFFKGAILESGFTSATAVIRKVTRGLVPQTLYAKVKWPSIDRIGAVKLRCLIIHGDRDKLVPVSMAYELHAHV